MAVEKKKMEENCEVQDSQHTIVLEDDKQEGSHIHKMSGIECIYEDNEACDDDDADDPSFSDFTRRDSKCSEQVECLKFHKKYKNKKSLASHIRVKHKETLATCAKMPCLEKECDFRASRIANLISHLVRIHKKKFLCEKVTFQHQEEFWPWKRKTEEQCRSTYSAITSSRELASGDRKIFLRCNRSGFSKPSDSKSAVSSTNRRGSMKINAVCTSFMSAKFFKEGGAVVHFCRTHYGHKEDNAGIRMNDDERNMIKSLIIKGLTASEIITTMKARLPAHRHQLIKYGNIRNVSVRQNLQLNRSKGLHSKNDFVLESNKYDNSIKSCDIAMNLKVENEVEIEAGFLEPEIEISFPSVSSQKHNSEVSVSFQTYTKEQLRSDVVTKAQKISELAVGLVSKTSLVILSQKLDSILNYMNDEEQIQIIPDKMESSSSCDQIKHMFDDQSGNSISLLCSDRDVNELSSVKNYLN
ncbi:uncharacterized protein LOC135202394 [Macrobrachium nipponense]|uniref:uncharacterized protein LOC135202394 n=1 Tax=Macrobrachium nipponense TaxID=159736 RepID=UPI0030C8C906